MKREHYLAAVSAAIERGQQLTDAAYEAYADLLRQADLSDATAIAALDAAFFAECGRAYLATQDTIANLRKWPRS